jgi:Tat protein secretion system quality control protein TatD with DNase activity
VTKQSPLSALVTETDSYYQHPYLRGPINVPLNVKYSIAAIAHSHNISHQEVSKITVENAINFFNLNLDP